MSLIAASVDQELNGAILGIDPRLVPDYDPHFDYEAERESCRGEGVGFWKYASKVLTEDVDGDGRIKPFPVRLKFLHRVYDELMTHANTWILKSRRMIVTTLIALIVHHGMLFTDLHAGDLFSAIYIRQSEEDAKFFIRRIAGIDARLPWYMRTHRFDLKNNSELHVAGGGGVIAMHAGGDGPRGEGYTHGILDEFAFQENAERNYQALAQNTRRLWVISTPNGSGNMFYRVMTKRSIPEAHRIELHYTEHEDRAPKDGYDWYKAALLAKMDKKDFDREHDMKFDVYSEQGHYEAEFKNGMQREFEWDGHSIIKRGWDFGYYHPACTWGWVEKGGIWLERKELLGEMRDTGEFAAEVFEKSDIWFPGADFQDACDPAVVQKRSLKSALGADSDYAELLLVAKKMGRSIQPRFERISGKEVRFGHRMVRGLLKPRGDGEYGFYIHPDCKLSIEGFKGGYRLPKDATPRQKDMEEKHPGDDTYCHLMDTIRYKVMQFLLVQSVPEHAIRSAHDPKRMDVQQLAARLRAQNSAFRAGRGL